MPLGNARYPTKNPDWLAAGAPSGQWAENLPRRVVNTDLAALTTQIMSVVGISLPAGFVATNITFKSGATAAGTPTNWWFALYDNAATPNLLAQTADQLTAAWAANAAKTLPLATAQTISTPGVYYVACMVKATTVPTLIGFTSFATAVGGVLAADKTLSVTSGSSLTTTAPATLASPTNVATVPYAVLT